MLLEDSKMSLLPDDKKELLRTEFKEKLVDPVHIVMFTQEVECRFCSDTRTLAEEVATLSDKINVDVFDFLKDAELAKQYGIDKTPAIAVIGKIDYGVRIYGIPYGYELQTFIEAMTNVSRGTTDLTAKTKEIIKETIHFLLHPGEQNDYIGTGTCADLALRNDAPGL